MKKIVVILLSILLITGCGSKNDENALKGFQEKVNKLDSYIVKGEMVIVSNEDKFTYDVEVSNKGNKYYKVNLINKTNDHEQVILKNDEAVYVVTPSLNKSFKFQSEWPNNGSQAYLLDSLVRDIEDDDNASVEKNDSGYKISCKVNYPNNSNLVKEYIYIDKDYTLSKVEVMDSDDNVKITFNIKNIDKNASFNEEYFDLDMLVDIESDECNKESCTNSTTTTKKVTDNSTSNDNETTNENTQNSEQNTENSESETTSNILDDIIYPLYVPTDTYLSTSDKVNTDTGNRVILTFAGEKPFMLVEEMSVASSEFEIIPVYGDPLIMADTIGALSANSLYWTSNNVDYYITSETLSGEEILTIAEGMGNSSLIVNAVK